MAELNSSPQKAGGRNRFRKPAPRVDLTAMVDLAFLLITFFILTTTLTKPKAMDIVMPVGNEPGAVPETRTLTICLGKNNSVLYYLGLADKPIIPATVTDLSSRGIRKAIFEIRNTIMQRTGKSMIVMIKPAETSVYENLVSTIDELKIGNIQQYAIADIAQKDIDMLKEKRVY
jgi:biopolymer transport protein ExbD